MFKKTLAIAATALFGFLSSANAKISTEQLYELCIKAGGTDKECKQSAEFYEGQQKTDEIEHSSPHYFPTVIPPLDDVGQPRLPSDR